MEDIRAGFARAEQITRLNAKTFHFASRFLPAQKRQAAYAVYAVCRISDDTVDDAPAGSAEGAQKELRRLREAIHAAYAKSPPETPLLAAFRQTVSDYRIPVRYFDDLIDGMEMDITKTRYENFQELHDYCYRVAGVVGLIMLRIFGSTHVHAHTHAVELGVAMQLTNILRDIREDFLRGRIYLPQDELLSCGVTESMIADSLVTPQFIELLRRHIARARHYYRNAASGVTMIADKHARFVVRVMKESYAGILSAIERNRYDVFSRRAHVPLTGKLLITAKILTTGEH